MAEGAWDIPDLEALLRSVVRQAMESELGSSWLTSLPAKMQKQVSDGAALARRKRPREQLRETGMPPGCRPFVRFSYGRSHRP